MRYRQTLKIKEQLSLTGKNKQTLEQVAPSKNTVKHNREKLPCFAIATSAWNIDNKQLLWTPWLHKPTEFDQEPNFTEPILMQASGWVIVCLLYKGIGRHTIVVKKALYLILKQSKTVNPWIWLLQRSRMAQEVFTKAQTLFVKSIKICCKVTTRTSYIPLERGELCSLLL